MEEIIKELLQKGIEITRVYLRNEELAIVLLGFYKSGTATLDRIRVFPLNRLVCQ